MRRVPDTVELVHPLRLFVTVTRNGIDDQDSSLRRYDSAELAQDIDGCPDVVQRLGRRNKVERFRAERQLRSIGGDELKMPVPRPSLTKHRLGEVHRHGQGGGAAEKRDEVTRPRADLDDRLASKETRELHDSKRVEPTFRAFREYGCSPGELFSNDVAVGSRQATAAAGTVAAMIPPPTNRSGSSDA